MSERRLYADIADRIIALIDDGTYPPGSRLPGERELAAQFGVSRITIREAQIALQAAKRITVKSGSGARVLEAQSNTDLPNANALELTQARSLIEGEAAAMAALSISDGDLEKLDTYVAAMAGETEPDEAIGEDADRDFHLCIARASGNPVIADAVERLWRLRVDDPGIQHAYAAICGISPEIRLKEHADIVDALRARDTKRARAAMQHHFACILEALLQSEEQREIARTRKRTEDNRRRFLSIPVAAS